ncbi:hypothetical protein ISO77_00875 [Morganella morganii subsp. morganii]|uniref:hypothetical protein n=1 Tax=Morganella morganii TaxID=582 RepID=UPI001BDA5B51|nr:hypothetical protein [Morganella morganii]MBT0394096.1 hypothetical protein [Morganella morganii subsp. morganii]
MGIKKTVLWLLVFMPVLTQARVVSDIKISVTGNYDSEDRAEYEKEGCKTFNPTKKQLIYYFTKAEESDSNNLWMHEYYSPCIASGTIIFKGGDSGKWILHSSGLGWVDFTDGKLRYFYYTDNEWDK